MKQQIFQALEIIIKTPQKSTTQITYLLNKQPQLFFIQLLQIIENSVFDQKTRQIGLIILKKSLSKALSYNELSNSKFLIHINFYWDMLQKLLFSQRVQFLDKIKMSSSFGQLMVYINSDEIKKLLKDIMRKQSNYTHQPIQYMSIVLSSIQKSNVPQDLKYQILKNYLFIFSQQIIKCIQNLKTVLLQSVQDNKLRTEILFKKYVKVLLFSLPYFQYFYQILLKTIEFVFQFQSSTQYNQPNKVQWQFQGTKQIVSSQLISQLVNRGIYINMWLKIGQDTVFNIINFFEQKGIDKKMKLIKVQSFKIMVLICKNLTENYQLKDSPLLLISGIPNLVQEVLKQLYNFTINFPKIQANIQIWKDATILISQIFQFLTECTKFFELRKVFENLSQDFIFKVGICNMTLSSDFIQEFQIIEQECNLQQFCLSCLKQQDQLDLSVSLGRWLRIINKVVGGIESFCFKICLQLSWQIITANPIMNLGQVLEFNGINPIAYLDHSLSSYLSILTRLTINQLPNINTQQSINQFLCKINLQTLNRLQLCSFFMFLKNIVGLCFKKNNNLTNLMIKFLWVALSQQICPQIYSHLVFAQKFMVYLCQVHSEANSYSEKQQINTIFLSAWSKLLNKLSSTSSFYFIDLLDTVLNHHHLKDLQIFHSILAKFYYQTKKRLIEQIQRPKDKKGLIIFKILGFSTSIIQLFSSIDLSSNNQRHETSLNDLIANTQMFLISVLSNCDKLNQQQKKSILQFVKNFTNHLQFFNNWNTISNNGSLIKLIIKTFFALETKQSPKYYLAFYKISVFNKILLFQSKELIQILDDSASTLKQHQDEENLNDCLSFLTFLYFYFVEYKFTFQKWVAVYQKIEQLVIKSSAFESTISQYLKMKIFGLYLISLRQNNDSRKALNLLSFIQGNIKSINTQYLVIYLYGLNHSKQKIPFQISIILLRLIVQQLGNPSKPQIVTYPYSNISPYQQAHQVFRFLQQKSQWVQGQQYKSCMILAYNKINAMKNKILVNGQPRTLLRVKVNKLKHYQELQI